MTRASPPPSDRRRNSGIDTLRGLSIALVVAHHVGLRIPLKHGALATVLPDWFLDALIFNGYEAVFVFFVVSGFLIASNSLTRWGRLAAIDLRAFYVRRAARILPSLVLLVGVLSLLHLAGAQDYVISRTEQSLPRAVVAALGLHLNWYEGHTGYLPGNWDVLWSLSIEESFYLGFPLACVVLRREAALAFVLAVLALSLPASRAALAGNEIWQEKAYLPGLGGIAVGVLAAIVARRLKRPDLWAVWLLGALGAVGLGAVLCFEGWLWHFLGNGSMLLLTLSTGCLVLALHWHDSGGPVHPFPGLGPLRSLGRLSYEVYLTHMFVVWPVVGAFKASGSDPRWGFLWYVPAFALSWSLGWLVARYVSSPCERALGQYLVRERAQVGRVELDG